MYTKENLSQQFDLSEKTVEKTLQISGLDAGKQEYSASEVEEFFAPARKMLSAGIAYKEVKAYFQMKLGEPVELHEEEEFHDLSVAVAQIIADAVENSVREVLPSVSKLVAKTVDRKLGIE